MTLIELSQVLGNFGEFFGAIAVVLTLAYLSIQVRHSSRVVDQGNALAKAAALDEGFNQWSRFRQLLVSDPDVTRVWLDGRKGVELSEVDDERFSNLVKDLEVILRNNYSRQRTVGNIGISESMPVLWATAIQRNPGIRKHWDVRGMVADDTGFYAAVELQLEKAESNTMD